VKEEEVNQNRRDGSDQSEDDRVGDKAAAIQKPSGGQGVRAADHADDGGQPHPGAKVPEDAVQQDEWGASESDPAKDAVVALSPLGAELVGLELCVALGNDETKKCRQPRGDQH